MMVLPANQKKDMLSWLWLSCALGAQSTIFGSLYRDFGSPSAIMEADLATLQPLSYMTPANLSRLLDKSTETAAKILYSCEKNDIRILPFNDPAYPDLLRSIPDPPVLLYVKGNLPDLDNALTVGMVGSRQCSEYAASAAYTIAGELCAAGVVVISGMAAGIDSAVAGGALHYGGPTVAVFGCGVDIVYPSANQKLAESIAARGALVSEYPPGTSPTRYTFPQRNRIISGMSRATFVVEAGDGSGALITGRYAVMQGRDVFAMPGRPNDPSCAGTNRMLAAGVRVALGSGDILSFYGIRPARHLSDFGITGQEIPGMTEAGYDIRHSTAKAAKRPKPKKPAEKEPVPQAKPAPLVHPQPPDDLSETQKVIYEKMPIGQNVAPEFFAGFGISMGEALAALTVLEIKHLVKSCPGGQYCLVD